MSVWRLWRALTRMVLRGRGGYQVGMVLDDGGLYGEHDGPGLAASGLADWVLTRTSWVGGEDRFVVLSGEPEDLDGYQRTVGSVKVRPHDLRDPDGAPDQPSEVSG